MSSLSDVPSNPSEARPHFAVILAGGSGTRLWPLSRPDRPKHLLPLLDSDESLLQATARRVMAIVGPRGIWTVTQARQSEETRRQLARIDPKLVPGILSEPAGRNTLPAIAWAVLHIAQRCPDAIVSVFPSDHLIAEAQAFQTAWDLALTFARQGLLMTFGIHPKSPETGYGYIRADRPLDVPGIYAVDSFTEKPDRNTAEAYVASGHYLWNAGMFVFLASLFLEELKNLQPSLDERLRGLVRSEISDEEFARGYADLPSLSMDYGLLEKSRRVGVVPAEMGWCDLGSWDALRRFLVDSKRSQLTAILLDEVQKAYDSAEKREPIARPWGTYTVLEEGPGYKIKKIVVEPGQKLSLQWHDHRAEHWVVIEGTAKVTCGDRILEMRPNESTFIPQGERHRLENPGNVPLIIIEVQTGSYVGEDDITRIDDIYGRSVSR